MATTTKKPGLKLAKEIVNYEKTLIEMILEAKFQYFDLDFNSRNFPSLRQGVEEIESTLVRIDRWMTTGEVRRMLHHMGLRPAYLKECLASLINKDVPMPAWSYVSVAVLGSKWRSHEMTQIPHIRLSGEEKRMHLVTIDSPWPPGWHFAAVKL